MLPFRLNRPLRHILFWAGIIVFFSSFEFLNSQALRTNTDYAKLYWINFFVESLPTYLCFTYALLYGIVPLLFQKRFVLSLAWLGGSVVLSILVQKALSEIDFYLVQPFLLNLSSDISFSFSSVWEDLKHLEDWITFSYDFIFVGFAAVGIKLFTHWYQKEQENQRLEREKLQTELKLLKLQLNPTFLFGALSSLHDLTQYQPKQAPEVVLKLAHFLRYVLYESQAERVPLVRETEIIDYYIDLQRAIYPVGLEVSLTIRGLTDKPTIAPLLLFPLVEQAFRRLPIKRAALPTSEPVWVSIDLAVSETYLTLKVINGHNIGQPDDAAWLADVQKQLRFHYGGAFDLQVRSDMDTHIVSLTLPLQVSVQSTGLKTHKVSETL